MTRCSTMPLALATLFVAATASAQNIPNVPMASRGIVLPRGQSQASVDLNVGLDKGAEGRIFGVSSGLAGDRTPGLNLSTSPGENFELGLSLQFLYSLDEGYKRDLTQNSDQTLRRRIAGWPYDIGKGNSHLGPLYLYGRYAFLPFMGVELGVIAPTEPMDGLNRPAIRLGFPLQYIASPGLLKLHARPDLILGFAKSATPAERSGAPAPGSTVRASGFLDLGATLSIADFYADLTVGVGGDMTSDQRMRLPLTILFGYTIIPRLDVYAGFTLSNLIPGSYTLPDGTKVAKAGAADQRDLTVGFNVRY